MIWGGGLRINPGLMHAQAARIASAADSLQRTLEATEHTPLGPWRGAAARAERDTRRRLVDAMKRQHTVLRPASGR